MSDSEMRQYMSEEVRSAVYNELTAEDNQKTNLEETDSASHKQAVSKVIPSPQNFFHFAMEILI
jgi:hypothetical protein